MHPMVIHAVSWSINCRKIVCPNISLPRSDIVQALMATDMGYHGLIALSV